MIDIHPLSPSRLGDFMKFFDGEAFSDNPSWASCYCQCYYEDHSRVIWSERTAVENRACAARRITSQSMRGFLAYREGKVVGWCNAAPRTLLHALDAEPIPDAGDTATIVCFLIIPGARGQGIATALLAAACSHLEAAGFQRIEANPRVATDSPTENHFGPLSMYLAAGFVQEREDSDGSVWVVKQC